MMSSDYSERDVIAYQLRIFQEKQSAKNKKKFPNAGLGVIGLRSKRRKKR